METTEIAAGGDCTSANADSEPTEEMRRWAELEINFLNWWMNRRLLKAWEASQDTWPLEAIA